MERSLLSQLDADVVQPGGLALLVVLALVLATVLLLRSFTRQLKKIDFEEEPEPGQPPDADGDTDPTAGKS